MSEIRNFVTFNADFVDDAQWTDNGDLLVPGGRTIADALCFALQKIGCVVSPVSQQSFYGWTFDANIENLTLNCVLQAGADWLLVATPKPTLTGRLFGNHIQSFRKFVIILHDVLVNDRRVSKVFWYTREDYEAGKTDQGSPIP
jgi:hypothetical protein